MAVIVTGRLCRRNAMANIFANFDIADIEYLKSLVVSDSTSSIPNPADSAALQSSSTNLEDSSCYQSEDSFDDDDQHRDSSDCR